jgi:stearoyl-CoA desaturase (delta-9 desaturase)
LTLLAEQTVETPDPIDGPRPPWAERIAIAIFVVIPLIAVIGAIPLLWGHGISLLDVILASVFYAVAGHGITVGYHRYFTHGSFKATRGTKIALGLAGSLAIQGSIFSWVADHRRHHAFSDKPGDPHSPHRYGAGAWNIVKGLWHSHLGWLFTHESTDRQRYIPDLLADPDLRAVDRAFPYAVVVTLLGPALLGGLISGTFIGALTAFFWAGLVRVFVLHHVTWSINSICHTFGNRPYKTRDKSTNFAPLAFLSMGECWHNLHHADPTLARHGVKRGQIDSTACVIRMLELTGRASAVRWPTQERLAAKAA